MGIVTLLCEFVVGGKNEDKNMHSRSLIYLYTCMR
jgi:hypothetical protein